jgi:hypothetical protein
MKNKKPSVPAGTEGFLVDLLFRGTTLVGQRCRQMRATLGGAEGTRTPDPNTASVVLSQLSYSPQRRDLVAAC